MVLGILPEGESITCTLPGMMSARRTHLVSFLGFFFWVKSAVAPTHVEEYGSCQKAEPGTKVLHAEMHVES